MLDHGLALDRVTTAAPGEDFSNAKRNRPGNRLLGLGVLLGCTGNVLQHVAEDQPVQGEKSVPVKVTQPA